MAARAKKSSRARKVACATVPVYRCRNLKGAKRAKGGTWAEHPSRGGGRSHRAEGALDTVRTVDGVTFDRVVPVRGEGLSGAVGRAVATPPPGARSYPRVGSWASLWIRDGAWTWTYSFATEAAALKDMQTRGLRRASVSHSGTAHRSLLAHRTGGASAIRYRVIMVNDRTGTGEVLAGPPTGPALTHREATTILSKQTPRHGRKYAHIRILLEPTSVHRDRYEFTGYRRASNRTEGRTRARVEIYNLFGPGGRQRARNGWLVARVTSDGRRMNTLKKFESGATEDDDEKAARAYAALYNGPT